MVSPTAAERDAPTPGGTKSWALTTSLATAGWFLCPGWPVRVVSTRVVFTTAPVIVLGVVPCCVRLSTHGAPSSQRDSSTSAGGNAEELLSTSTTPDAPEASSDTLESRAAKFFF